MRLHRCLLAVAALLAVACFRTSDATAATADDELTTLATSAPTTPEHLVHHMRLSSAWLPPDTTPAPEAVTDPVTHPIESDPATHPIVSNPVTHPIVFEHVTHPIVSDPVTHPIVTNPVTHPIVTNPVTHLVVTDFVTPTVLLPAATPSPSPSQLATTLAPPGRSKGPQAHQPHPHPCQSGHQRPHRCEAVGTRLFCSGFVHRVTRSRRTDLVLCFWSEDLFDPGRLRFFPLLRRLQVTESNITEVLDFPYHDHLEELVLAGLRLTWLSEGAFVGLRKLSLLDLSGNQLGFLDGKVLLRLPSLKHVMLGGNPWRCTLALAWMVEEPLRGKIADRGSMQCGAALYPRRPVDTIVSLLKHVATECPAGDACACELTRVVRDARPEAVGGRGGGVGAAVGSAASAGGDLVPIITVNCSHRGLAATPRRLPANTTTLLLRGNHIAAVRPLLDRHPDVLDVYLDDNLVESVADLEGSPWLSSFRVLSLRANKLQQLPTYALDNALERNVHAVRLYLGLNPWRCDCQFMPNFQELLAKYKALIADWDDIRCAAVEGDDNSLKKIHALSRRAVCRDEGEPRVSALDLVNVALGLSLLAVLVKLAFDFWQYRRYGRLPWIAAKLP